MGKTDRPSAGVKLPMTYREFGIKLNSDNPEHVVSVGFDRETARRYEDMGEVVVWRAVSQWLSLDTMG